MKDALAALSPSKPVVKTALKKGVSKVDAAH